MTNGRADWTKLPVEVLLKIFSLANEGSHENSFALVCRGWSKPAQTVLFSKISIETLPQLRTFHDIIQLYPNLRKQVKKITLSGTIVGHGLSETEEKRSKRIEALKLFSNLLNGNLPYLEEIEDNVFNSYAAVLFALLDSHLQRLEIISKPKQRLRNEDPASYVACLLLLRNRLKKMSITKEGVFKQDYDSGLLYFNRLYSRLHQFHKLTKLEITTTARGEINDLEYITANCKSLTSLTLNSTTSIFPSIHNISIHEQHISTLTPSHNIKELNLALSMSRNFREISYIMHKFQGLRRLYLSIEEVSLGPLDQRMLSQLLNFLSKIDSYHIRSLYVDDHPLWETLSGHWGLISKIGCIPVRVYDEGRVDDIIRYFLDIDNGQHYGTELIITYYSLNEEANCNTLIEKIGRYIHRLKFDIFTDNTPEIGISEQPKDFIANTIAHCPNLKNLKFEDCALKPSAHESVDYSKQIPILGLLDFQYCFINNGVFEQLSLLLPNIKQLNVCAITQSKVIQPMSEDVPADIAPDKLMLKIIMPNSKIEMIEIGAPDEGVDYYIKLYSMSEGKTNYYRFNNHLEPATEVEYLAADSGRCAYICTQTEVDSLSIVY